MGQHVKRSVAATSKSEGDGPSLKPNQLQAIVLLVEGKTNSATAEAVGVHPATITTWLRENDGFRAEFEKQRLEAYQRGIQLAHKTLTEVMENKSEPGQTKVRAAQAELLYDSQCRRFHGVEPTVYVVLDRLQQSLQAIDEEVLEAKYSVSNGPPALPEVDEDEDPYRGSRGL